MNLLDWKSLILSRTDTVEHLDCGWIRKFVFHLEAENGRRKPSKSLASRRLATIACSFQFQKKCSSKRRANSSLRKFSRSISTGGRSRRLRPITCPIQNGDELTHVFGAFELDIQPETPDNPASVRIALMRYTRAEDGRLLITPECASFEEVEGQINSLQDELDEIWERARRAFQVA